MDFPRCLEQTFLTACEINDIERAGACLALEADPNIKTEDGECLCGLIYAAEKNYPELCDLLLAHPNIDVNIRDGDDGTPLMLSCCEGHSEITGKLARAPGVDFNCQGIDGSTAATWAAAKNKTECLQILATQESVDWNIQDDYGRTAAICAVANNHVECVRILLTIPQVNWNLKTNDKDPIYPNSSALTLALEDGNKEMINLVLTANGLQLDIDHLKSKDVFSDAVTACQDFVFEKMGEDRVNDKEMVTLFALEHDIDAFAKILVQDLIDNEEATFSKRDSNQNSALMICLKKKKMEFVDMLLASAKTNVNVEDANGDNAATFALKNDMKDCLKKILGRADLLNHYLSIAMEKKDLDEIKEIMKTKRTEERVREECPVCFNVFTSRMKIFQCTQGHFTCETCRKEMQRCPECREDFMGRAIGFERYLRKYDS